MAQYSAMLPQPWMNGARVVGDVKPRLTKEQHDILESHFRQQHKPSTQTKKGFAETLGVPLDKINVGFHPLAVHGSAG
ncbi:MAG: homeobox domain-containing protein [Terriglobus roseus]|nr:homeobox domain-containing protein [Terriglobus roseus]